MYAATTRSLKTLEALLLGEPCLLPVGEDENEDPPSNRSVEDCGESDAIKTVVGREGERCWFCGLAAAVLGVVSVKCCNDSVAIFDGTEADAAAPTLDRDESDEPG